MTYNEREFESQEIRSINHETDLLIKHQSLVLDFFRDFLESCDGKEVPEHHEVFVHLLVKIRFNIEAGITLVPELKDDARKKISINLIYRSMIDDIVNVYYLLGFITKAADTQISLKNELDILHKEFLMSCEHIFEAEIGINNYIYSLQGEEVPDPVDVKSVIQQMRADNPEVYDLEKGNYKNNKELRLLTMDQLKPFLKNTNHVNFLSESQKIIFIKARGFERHVIYTHLFKYFSQYQHYSPKMHQLNLSSALLDLRYYRWSILEALNAIGDVNIRLGFSDIPKKDMKIKELITNMIKWQ